MQNLFSKKQWEFILNCGAKWNLAHGSVRSSKTVGTLFAFMTLVDQCPDSQIFMVGHSSETIYENAIRLIMESPQFVAFRPYCTWTNRKLLYKDKTIVTLGAKDEGAIGSFQGKTMSLVYCDEMTLYPESIIDMIDTRLSQPWSKGIATMNPAHPTHKLKQWIDKADAGDPNYYALHFTLDDNPYVDEVYKQRVANSLSGLFYKRNYLGLWCLAQGAIFDFFDRSIHVVRRPPIAADYFIAGVDYGTVNPFACVVIGVYTGIASQRGKQLWVEAEYYWDPSMKGQGRQKVNSELADDVAQFLEPYGVQKLYIDPSAAAFKLELRRRGLHPIDADNDVFNGIQTVSDYLRNGKCLVMDGCKNLIREIETYSWDTKKAERGEDEPLKKDDHAVDALRYALHTHKVPEYNPYKQNHNPDKYMQSQFTPGRRSIFG